MSKANLARGWKKSLDTTISQIIAQEDIEFSGIQLINHQLTEHCIVMNTVTFKEARKRLWKNQPIPEDHRYRGALVVVLEFLEGLDDKEKDGDFDISRRNPLEDGYMVVMKFSDPRMNDSLRKAPEIRRRGISLGGNHDERNPSVQVSHWLDNERRDYVDVDGRAGELTVRVEGSIVRLVKVDGHWKTHAVLVDEKAHGFHELESPGCPDCKSLMLEYEGFEPADVKIIEYQAEVSDDEH